MSFKEKYLLFFAMLICNTVFGYSIKIEGNNNNINGIYSSNKENQHLILFLQQQIQLITDSKLNINKGNIGNQIVLEIGGNSISPSLFANCEPDAFYFGVKGSNYYILGNSKVGLEFGIYEFVEKVLGITWLMPTAKGKFVPKKKDLVLRKSGKVNNPAFKSRQLSPLDYYGNGELNDWAKYSKIFSSLSFHHNMNFFIRNSDIKMLDKDMFPSYSGKKYIPKNNEDHKWQPNFKSKKFLDYSIQRVDEYFTKTKSSTFSLGINDNYLISDNMKGEINRSGYSSYSNEYYTWVNQLVGALNEKFPNKKFGLLAYYNVSNPPSFKLESNVVPYITFERLKWRFPSESQSDKSLTIEWSTKAKELGWYDYQYGLTYMIPRNYSRLTKEYLVWALNNGVKYYYAELYPNWGEGPKSWILSKLLWDPSQDVSKLEYEWYNKAVGNKSAPYLKAYFDIWEDYWTNKLRNDDWFAKQKTFLPFNDLGYLKDVSNTMVASAQENLDLALSNVTNDSEKQRVQVIREMWELYKSAINEYKTGRYKNFNSLKNSRKFMLQLNKLESNDIHKPIVQVLKNNLK